MENPCDDPFFPPDLLVEILLRLPVKTLLRFRCVSRSWKSLIDDLSFVKLHLKRSSKHTQILLSVIDATVDFEDFDTYVIPCSMHRWLEEPSPVINDEIDYHLKENQTIFGSCNGLVCLGRFYDVDLIEELRVQIRNPATHLRSKKSPTLRMNLQTRVQSLRRKVNFGFGYDVSCDTYKVVVVFWDCIEQKMEIRVHCMADNCWRNIICDPSFPLLLNIADGKFAGGCLNWLALKNLNGPEYKWYDVTLQQLVIVSFDVSTDLYTYLPLPEGISEVPHDEPQLEILGDRMYLFHDQNNTHLVLWQMREYGNRESWTRLVSVTYEHLHFVGFLSHMAPIWLSEDGDILLIANRENMDVIKYNIRDNNVERIQYPNNEVWVCANDYVPSLVSPCQE